MNVSCISDHVHYIGLNDRTIHKFEAMWPMPYGVSYNSYLVIGEDKIAVIDGVEAGHAFRHIDHILEITGGRHPDYLVINHMEPDHSGALELLRKTFPAMEIVGNAQTLAMIKGYYGIENGLRQIKDGESIDLGGGVGMDFYLTPMVHWPETMMTYIAADRLLFSGDAFGCFGALCGAVVDKDMDTSHYFPEMVRYYSNIVGKYGQPVQMALKKLSGLEIETICPTHGPVWHDQLSDVVDLYDKLSRYEPLDNGVTIVYGSMYGNTEVLAEEAATALASAGVKNISIHNAAVSDLSYILADVFRHKGLIIASPTYSNSLFPPVRAVMEALENRGMKNRVVGLIGSHTWAQQALKAMTASVEATSMTLVGEPVNLKHAPGADKRAECRVMATALAEAL
ncbi:MAG: FprA family A-type flavoprotein [Bacteroidales bacterium]|nr:FprA family A-type flavoprotein [Bacteroidales bacterium]